MQHDNPANGAFSSLFSNPPQARPISQKPPETVMPTAETDDLQMDAPALIDDKISSSIEEVENMRNAENVMPAETVVEDDQEAIGEIDVIEEAVSEPAPVIAPKKTKKAVAAKKVNAKKPAKKVKKVKKAKVTKKKVAKKAKKVKAVKKTKKAKVTKKKVAKKAKKPAKKAKKSSRKAVSKSKKGKKSKPAKKVKGKKRR